MVMERFLAWMPGNAVSMWLSHLPELHFLPSYKTGANSMSFRIHFGSEILQLMIVFKIAFSPKELSSEIVCIYFRKAGSGEGSIFNGCRCFTNVKDTLCWSLSLKSPASKCIFTSFQHVIWWIWSFMLQDAKKKPMPPLKSVEVLNSAKACASLIPIEKSGQFSSHQCKINQTSLFLNGT